MVLPRSSQLGECGIQRRSPRDSTSKKEAFDVNFYLRAGNKSDGG